jgi:hypothetical protein
MRLLNLDFNDVTAAGQAPHEAFERDIVQAPVAQLRYARAGQVKRPGRPGLGLAVAQREDFVGELALERGNRIDPVSHARKMSGAPARASSPHRGGDHFITRGSRCDCRGGAVLRAGIQNCIVARATFTANTRGHDDQFWDTAKQGRTAPAIAARGV